MKHFNNFKKGIRKKKTAEVKGQS